MVRFCEHSIRIDRSCIMTHGSVVMTYGSVAHPTLLGRTTHYCES